MQFRRRSSEDHLDINLIPLIDVLLVVLIFLAASTRFVEHKQVSITLPQAQSAQAWTDELLVAVDREGHYAVGDQWVSAQATGALTLALSQYAEQHQKTSLLVLADEQAPHGAIVQLLDAARQSGIHQINFGTRKP